MTGPRIVGGHTLDGTGRRTLCGLTRDRAPGVFGIPPRPHPVGDCLTCQNITGKHHPNAAVWVWGGFTRHRLRPGTTRTLCGQHDTTEPAPIWRSPDVPDCGCCARVSTPVRAWALAGRKGPRPLSPSEFEAFERARLAAHQATAPELPGTWAERARATKRWSKP